MEESISKSFLYEGNGISFQKGERVMVNATEMAKPFGKKPAKWFDNPGVHDFIETLARARGLAPMCKKRTSLNAKYLAERYPTLVKVAKGGLVSEVEQGTWLHEDVAMEFARWLSPKFAIWCNDRIKELLTTGPEMPKDYIQALEALLASEKEKVRLEEERLRLQESNQYQASIIEGLTEDIPTADLRQRINEIVRKADGYSFRNAWHFLYDEFDKKFHINSGLRYSNSGAKKSYLEFVEQDLGMIRELYELACKLFEGSYQQLMDSWSKHVMRAEPVKRRR